MSLRLGSGDILITQHQASLGSLQPKEIVRVSSAGEIRGKGSPSSELPLHLAIYGGLPVQAVLHAHPLAALAFSGSGLSFLPISLEDRFLLGDVPIVDQETPTVTEPERVVEPLKRNRIVILKNHGTVAVGNTLMEAFHLTDLLEAALKAQLFRSLFLGQPGPRIPKKKKHENPSANAFEVFSEKHRKALVDRVNNDRKIQELGRKSRFSTSLGFQLLDGAKARCWTFHFNNGRITRCEQGPRASYIFTALRETWKLVFQGELDPFVATLQGTITLTKGTLKDLSHWYRPCQEIFQVWQKTKPGSKR